MLHAALALGIYILPWRIALFSLVMFTIALSSLGVAVIVTAILGWTFFISRCWKYG